MWALISAPACGLIMAMLEGAGAIPTAAAAAGSSPEPLRMDCAVLGEVIFAAAMLPDLCTSGLPTIAELESAYGWTVCSMLNRVRTTEASLGRTVAPELSN